MKKILEIKLFNIYELNPRSAAHSVVMYLNDIIGLQHDVMNEIRASITEAIKNAVDHAYCEQEGQEINLVVSRSYEGLPVKLQIEVSDTGLGIKDISKAMSPLYTTKGKEEHAGLGFTIMKTFANNVEVISDYNNENSGTTVKLEFLINPKERANK